MLVGQESIFILRHRCVDESGGRLQTAEAALFPLNLANSKVHQTTLVEITHRLATNIPVMTP